MKRTWPLFPLIFAFIALFPARYSVSPALASNSSHIEAQAPEMAILAEARSLYAKYGHRPPYKGPVFPKNARLSAVQAKTALPYILACESGGRDVSEIDSNHQWSRGPAQFQDATWAARQKASGISGTPTEIIPAIDMSIWSLENGYVSQWSCARLERIIES